MRLIALRHRLGRLRAQQRGVTTLVITVLLLAIVTVIVLFSTNVAFFEQRTTNSESRSRTGEQRAEFALNVAGEFLKANLNQIVSDEATGWLSATDATVRRWARCADAATEIAEDYIHPCETLIGSNLVAGGAQPWTNLYFYARGGAADQNADIRVADTAGDNIHNIVRDGAFGSTLAGLLTQANATFTVAPYVQAVLCRIDTTDPANPRCAINPANGNNIAITLVGSASIGSESTDAVVMETWGSYNDFLPASTVPLVASGSVKGLGNAQIVANPNAGGPGLAASIWSPCAVEISGNETQPSGCEEPNSNGLASVATCHLQGFLGSVPESDLLTTCAANGNNCGCPGFGSRDFLSGHPQGGGAASSRESPDILDVDGNQGSPDITFFPGFGKDDPADPTDDNLFEWIFGLDYVSKSSGGDLENDTTGGTVSDCGEDGDENCAIWAMREELGFTFLTCAQLNALGANARGLYYVTNGSCGLPSQLGSPTGPAIVVIDGDAVNNNSTIYGMLFVRSDDDSAEFRGTGNAQVFGSVVVQGDVRLAGGIDIIYVDWSAQLGDPDRPPVARNFGRVSGSWLDAPRGF